MSDTTPRLALPVLPPTPLQPHVTHNEALAQLDALTDLCLKGQFVNTPPSSPADGDSYLLGGAPTGAWSGHAYKIAYCLDGAWRFFIPFDGLRAFVAGSNGFLVYHGGTWLDSNALLSASEVSVASAATCDLGAAGSLFVQVTGTTAITSLGTGANLLRFVRFAGALTLTWNATSLILPGGASITTAAGDSAIFASDGSGNWRCRGYTRANGLPLNVTASTGSGAMVLAAGPSFSGTVNVVGLQWSATPSANVGRSNTVFPAGAPQGTGYVLAGFNNEWGIRQDSADAINFDVYNASAAMTALRIGQDGSIGAGTTATGGWSGNAQAEFKTNGKSYALSAYTPSGGGALLANVDSTAARLADFWFNRAASVGSITTGGSSVTYNTTSDARLKTIGEQRDWRGAIRALWVGDFTWNGSGAPGFGVLAQQAYDVMPHHAGVTRPAQEDGAWHASSEPFAFLSLWGVKDLYALVDALAARVAALEAANAF